MRASTVQRCLEGVEDSIHAHRLVFAVLSAAVILMLLRGAAAEAPVRSVQLPRGLITATPPGSAASHQLPRRRQAAYDECSHNGATGMPVCERDGSKPRLPAGRHEATAPV